MTSSRSVAGNQRWQAFRLNLDLAKVGLWPLSVYFVETIRQRRNSKNISAVDGYLSSQHT